MAPRQADLSAIERRLQAEFRPDTNRQFTSTTDQELKESEYIKNLVLPVGARGKLPLTKDKFVIDENPALVEWERQTRLFLSKLNDDFGHRVTAPMVYEWTTGISIADLAKAEGVDEADGRGGGKTGSANSHLRHINKILADYFGKPYKTRIAGRDVGKAYKVRPHFKVRNKKPMCITLWPEWDNGTLEV